MKVVATLTLLTCVSTANPAAATPFRQLEERIEQRLADRFSFGGGISIDHINGSHSGVASITDRRRNKSYEVRVGDFLPSSPRFRLVRIERTHVELASRDYRIRVQMKNGKFGAGGWVQKQDADDGQTQSNLFTVEPEMSAAQLRGKTVTLCRQDAYKFCPVGEKDANATLSCLLENSHQVSPSCASVLSYSSDVTFDPK